MTFAAFVIEFAIIARARWYIHYGFMITLLGPLSKDLFEALDKRACVVEQFAELLLLIHFEQEIC